MSDCSFFQILSCPCIQSRIRKDKANPAGDWAATLTGLWTTSARHFHPRSWAPTRDRSEGCGWTLLRRWSAACHSKIDRSRHLPHCMPCPNTSVVTKRTCTSYHPSLNNYQKVNWHFLLTSRRYTLLFLNPTAQWSPQIVKPQEWSSSLNQNNHIIWMSFCSGTSLKMSLIPSSRLTVKQRGSIHYLMYVSVSHFECR